MRSTGGIIARKMQSTEGIMHEKQPEHSILIIDDDAHTRETMSLILEPDYKIYLTANGRDGINLAKKFTPDLILLDVLMPGGGGFDTIKIIKADVSIAHIPVIFLTGVDDTVSERIGFSLGAADYLKKPVDSALLHARIGLHILAAAQKKLILDYGSELEMLVAAKAQTVIRIKNAILSTLADLVEFRDEITGGHIERTQHYVETLAGKVIERGLYVEECAGWDVASLARASQLHDLGKVKIPDDILKKPGKLTDEEFETMKLHTVYGEEAIIKTLKKLNGDGDWHLQVAAEIAASHHERWDGKGYPHELKGTEIPLAGRIMAIADVYDALVSERQYKKPMTPDEALILMQANAGTQFDPVLIEIFAETITEYRHP